MCEKSQEELCQWGASVAAEVSGSDVNQIRYYPSGRSFMFKVNDDFFVKIPKPFALEGCLRQHNMTTILEKELPFSIPKMTQHKCMDPLYSTVFTYPVLKGRTLELNDWQWLRRTEQEKVLEELAHVLASFHRISTNEIVLPTVEQMWQDRMNRVVKNAGECSGDVQALMRPYQESMKEVFSAPKVVCHGDSYLSNVLFAVDSYDVISVLDMERMMLAPASVDLHRTAVGYTWGNHYSGKGLNKKYKRFSGRSVPLEEIARVRSWELGAQTAVHQAEVVCAASVSRGRENENIK